MDSPRCRSIVDIADTRSNFFFFNYKYQKTLPPSLPRPGRPPFRSPHHAAEPHYFSCASRLQFSGLYLLWGQLVYVRTIPRSIHIPVWYIRATFGNDRFCRLCFLGGYIQTHTHKGTQQSEMPGVAIHVWSACSCAHVRHTAKAMD